jgi:hypothetical protein
MESRLRTILEKHSNILLSKTASIDKTKEALYRQMLDRISALNNRMDIDEKEPNQKPATGTSIRLVSLDFEKSVVHQVIKDHDSGAAATFLNAVFDGTKEKEKFVKKGDYRGDEFVDKTHVTMAFSQRTSQRKMRDIFGPVLGCEVDLLLTGFLWSETHAAFAVTLPDQTVDGKHLPGSKNAFVHMTVWVAKGSKSVGSNELPVLVSEGEAHRVDLETQVCLRGKIAFWET